MVLLDSAINSSEIVFGMKDLIQIVGGVLATASAYLTLKYEFKAYKSTTETKFLNMQKDYDKEVDKLKEDIISSKRGRHAIKKELEEVIKERHEVTMKRIDKTQEEQKTYMTATNQEFKEINSKLDKIIGSLEK